MSTAEHVRLDEAREGLTHDPARSRQRRQVGQESPFEKDAAIAADTSTCFRGVPNSDSDSSQEAAAGRIHSRVTGSVIENVAPRSGLLAAQTLPPWRSTMVRLIDRPDPQAVAACS